MVGGVADGDRDIDAVGVADGDRDIDAVGVVDGDSDTVVVGVADAVVLGFGSVMVKLSVWSGGLPSAFAACTVKV